MDRAGQDIDGTETTATCKARLGKTFSDVTICKFKLRKLETSYRCNATEASAWVYYMPTAHFHILSMWPHEPVEWYNITWRGLACVAYLYEGAMRRPELRDKRGGTNSHVFFVSETLI